jgi:hypothetical protein
MVNQAQYLMLLCSFREQLQQHVWVHAVEAVTACREIEQSLLDSTGKTYYSFLHARQFSAPSLFFSCTFFYAFAPSEGLVFFLTIWCRFLVPAGG